MYGSQEQGRGHPADLQLAGLQLLRRQRRRESRDSWYADSRNATACCSAVRTPATASRPTTARSSAASCASSIHTGKKADYLSDEDLERFPSGDDLARLYDLIIFSGHEEYVTTHIYDLIQRYRDLGGNLAFLSADNFFRRVDLKPGSASG